MANTLKIHRIPTSLQSQPFGATGTGGVIIAGQVGKIIRVWAFGITIKTSQTFTVRSDGSNTVLFGPLPMTGFFREKPVGKPNYDSAFCFCESLVGEGINILLGSEQYGGSIEYEIVDPTAP